MCAVTDAVTANRQIFYKNWLYDIHIRKLEYDVKVQHRHMNDKIAKRLKYTFQISAKKLAAPQPECNKPNDIWYIFIDS